MIKVSKKQHCFNHPRSCISRGCWCYTSFRMVRSLMPRPMAWLYHREFAQINVKKKRKTNNTSEDKNQPQGVLKYSWSELVKQLCEVSPGNNNVLKSTSGLLQPPIKGEFATSVLSNQSAQSNQSRQCFWNSFNTQAFCQRKTQPDLPQVKTDSRFACKSEQYIIYCPAFFVWLVLAVIFLLFICLGFVFLI